MLTLDRARLRSLPSAPPRVRCSSRKLR